MKISPQYDGEKFFTVHNGVKMATPLFVVIMLIGIVDLVFAVDSIPAIFAITTDPFIVLTSNVFAILGLRAMYFLLAGMHERFHLLSYGLAIVLVFIGAKMLLIDRVQLGLKVADILHQPFIGPACGRFGRCAGPCQAPPVSWVLWCHSLKIGMADWAA